jgi:CHAD domain-containing protein
VEALLAFSATHDEKLRKQLRRTRRRAGVVRDLDVQLAALQTIHVPGAVGEQRRVTRALERRREKRIEKLREAVAQEARSLRKRLRKALASVAEEQRRPATAAADFARQALDQFATAVAQRNFKNEEDLHALRIACKKARYTAELASDDATAAEVVTDLKQIQDAIGQWRDWTMLVDAADTALDHPERSVLINALRAQARASLFRAVRVASDVSSRLLELRATLSGRKQPVKMPQARMISARAS